MNGYEIFKKAFLRLGFDSGNMAVLSHEPSDRNLEFINQIAEDLKLQPLKEMSAMADWKADEIQAVVCGVAMLLSFSEGESTKNQMLTELYNAKRAALLGMVAKIEDILPVAESGDV